ncbi:hypothetical protein PVAP13_4KG053433 [Panicum virgatum]|uniref:Uncharacterized protein n=1 Tax=Panicum virgatum TaxID=38727 RepID=A0A8T0TNZ6_PANVG|nr:hypothetical protein PVAP13_4KG053433 [Panicum virgatum]
MKHRPPRGLSIGHVWLRSARMGSQTLSSFLAQARPPAHRSRATRHPPSCISSDETRHQPARRSRCPRRARDAAAWSGGGCLRHPRAARRHGHLHDRRRRLRSLRRRAQARGAGRSGRLLARAERPSSSFLPCASS